jgi:AraC family transcriptional regulator
MNFYVSLITNVVDFVDANIHQTLPLDVLAQEFGFSAFHFNRIFRTVSGQTLKQYILGRKLSLAVERLGTGTESVIDVAFDFGFHSPEVFSRAFKKQFGISPDAFRKKQPRVATVQKPVIVERDIVNFQGHLALKGSEIHLNEIKLAGTQVEVNANSPKFETTLRSASAGFYQQAVASGNFAPEPFYALVNCLGDEDTGEYGVFYGLESPSALENLLARTIPAGWYEKFTYTGDVFDVRLNFVNDLYHWVIVKEIELEMNGIGMLNIFMADYPETHEAQILVPIKHG